MNVFENEKCQVVYEVLEGYIFLHSIFIDSNFRHRGLFRKILQELCERYGPIVLECNKNLVALWKHVGASVISNQRGCLAVLKISSVS